MKHHTNTARVQELVNDKSPLEIALAVQLTKAQLKINRLAQAEQVRLFRARLALSGSAGVFGSIRVSV